jgi:hypothetical protein
MASKRTEKKPTPKKVVKTVKAKAPKTATIKTSMRHPRARVADAFSGKAALAKTLAPAVARSDEDTDLVEARLAKASNAQLLRLQRVAEAVKAKWGNREKLIAAIGTAQKKSKDKDYLAKLDTYSLPQLFDIVKTVERAARA